MADKYENRVCDEWAYWLETKRFFAPPVQKNILLALQSLPTKPPPDAQLSQTMAFYNMAVNSQEHTAIAVWLIKTFNLKVYRNRKDAVHRLGFNSYNAFNDLASRTDKAIAIAYNNLVTNDETSKVAAAGVKVSYRNEMVD
jgi:hypothetical protein